MTGREGRPTGGGPAAPGPLGELIAALEEVRQLAPLELARAEPGLIVRAQALLAAARADALIELMDGGVFQSQSALARELGVSRGAVNLSIQHRKEEIQRSRG